MVSNFTKMIAGSLGLKEPWYIKGAEFLEGKQEVHVCVGIREGAAIACPHCGQAAQRYGYEPNERIWRHGDCMFFPTYVHCRRPRVLCPHCGVQQISAPFERKNSRFTLLFEGYAMLIMADMPRTKAARLLRCNEKSLAEILTYWVNKAVEERPLDDVSSLAIDETSFRRGHRYVTLVLDAQRRRVTDVEPGRGKDTVHSFTQKLEQRGGNRANIKSVTSDMSKSYVPAIREVFTNAIHVIDKFHVKQILINALDEVCKAEQKQVEDKRTLFLGRRLFMIPQSRLSEEQTKKLAKLSQSYPQTGRAYRIVAALDTFYACSTVQEAERTFSNLYSWMRRCRLQPMKQAAQSLLCHKEQIIAYFQEHITNAICEGINSMIQAAKRKARGYRTYEGYTAMIYLIAGKLQLAVPKPF